MLAILIRSPFCNCRLILAHDADPRVWPSAGHFDSSTTGCVDSVPFIPAGATLVFLRYMSPKSTFVGGRPRQGGVMQLETMDKRLIAAGCVVASVICLWFAIDGLRKGVVYSPRGHGRAVPVERDRYPLEFWVNVWVYFGASGGLLWWAWIVATG